MQRCPSIVWQLLREKFSGAVIGRNCADFSRSIKGHIRKWNIAVRILPGQPASPDAVFYLTEHAENAANAGLFCIGRSPRIADSNQHSEFQRKVSRVFLGNYRFAESQSGEWFDTARFGRLGSAMSGHVRGARTPSCLPFPTTSGLHARVRLA